MSLFVPVKAGKGFETVLRASPARTIHVWTGSKTVSDQILESSDPLSQAQQEAPLSL